MERRMEEERKRWMILEEKGLNERTEKGINLRRGESAEGVMNECEKRGRKEERMNKYGKDETEKQNEGNDD